MIRIQTGAGKTVRLTNSNHSQVLNYSTTHGFVSEKSLKTRQKMRLNASGAGAEKPKLFQVKALQNAGSLELTASENCQTQKLSDIHWKLKSPIGEFDFERIEVPVSLEVPDIVGHTELNQKSSRLFVLPFLLCFFGLVAAVIILSPSSENTEEEQLVETLKPVVVSPIEVKKLVETPKVEVEPKPQNQAIDKQAKAQKKLVQNLGFLKLVGKKELKNAVGGLPTHVPEASAGAGPGGKEGSGGQLLVGLGQGLRKTTVGNSGLAGLGGVGTKGAGGGLGGYGETDYGSGAGKSVSAMPLSQDAVISGGLDRSLIQATILRYLSQVRACYEEGLKKNADLIGQVTMAFEINGQGGLNYSNVLRSSLGDRDVEQCISKRMMTWKFPTPKGNVNVKVSYPFMLRPVKS